MAPKSGVGKDEGRTERHRIEAFRRKGRVNSYNNFSILASPKVSKAKVAVCSKTGEWRTTDMKNMRTSPKIVSCCRRGSCVVL
jgi:hypothetical protein